MPKYKLVRTFRNPVKRQIVKSSDNRSDIIALMLTIAEDLNKRGMRIEFKRNGFLVLSLSEAMRAYEIDEPDEIG